MTNNFSVGFIIPTFNAGNFLNTCLSSIARQNYPLQKIEIIIADGGSTDQTLTIARKFKCRILHNQKKLAEPGVNLGLQKSQAEINFIMAADNELSGENWITQMIKPFTDPQVIAAFPKQINSEKDSWITKYVNVFTDPFNHFVYGNANNTRTFHKVYQALEKYPSYTIYNYTLESHPILAMAQGFALRGGYQKPKGMEFDDMLPILDMIKNKQKIAYVFSAGIYHHSIKSLSHFVKKQKWAIDNALSGKSYGVGGRRSYFSLNRKIRTYLWPFYGISLIFPLIDSLRGLVFDKEKYWLYHLPISFFSALVFWQEILKIKILRQNAGSAGKP